MDNLTKKELWDTDNPPASNTMYICNLKKLNLETFIVSGWAFRFFPSPFGCKRARAWVCRQAAYICMQRWHRTF